MSETSVAYQSFIGVDLHKNTVTLAAVRPDGSLIDRVKIPTKCRDRIASWLLTRPRPSHLAVEAVGFVEWFIDDYRPCVDRLDIADATELANRRGKRRHNDPNDARDVAVRLARGECPLGYIADDELMQLRKLGRHWHQLSRLLSRSKHSMCSMLLAANVRGPRLDGPAAQKWILAFGHLLKPVQQQAFANFLDIIQLVERQRARLHLQITFANRAPRFRGLTELLQSVPGIAEVWACIIAAEIGPFDRFPNADALEFWAGMTFRPQGIGRPHPVGPHHQGRLADPALGAVQGGPDALPLRQETRGPPPAAHPPDRQAQGQRGHGPALAADPVCHGPRRQILRPRTGHQTQPRGQPCPAGPQTTEGGGLSFSTNRRTAASK